jgi:opacity protein-like surface antigen
MLARVVGRAAAALVAAVLGTTGAAAQKFDGTGLVKFGVFGQGTFLDVGLTQPFIASASPSGFAGGVSAGFDLVSRGNGWLLGVEIDGSFGDARDKADIVDFGFDYLATLRGRFGFFPRYDWLIYGTAGVGWLGIEAQRPGVGNKAVETLTGVVGGAGTEIDWHHVILFGEYLYGNFGDRSFTISDVRHRIDADAHIFRLGLKFKVGHDYEHDIDPVYRRYGGTK